MAVTAEDLGVALGLSDDGTDLPVLQQNRLNRLLGVGLAHVELLIPTAPEAIQDEVIVRLSSYLFDQGVGRRDAFANSWVNSGAGSLATRWQTRRVAGTTTTPDTSDTPSTGGGGGIMPMPSVRFYRIPFANPGFTFVDLQAGTAQDLVDAGVEVTAPSQRTVSRAAPIFCNSQSFEVGAQSAWQFYIVAVADGDDPPTNFQIGTATDTAAWPNRWTQASGQANISGANHDVYFWPVVMQTFPETVTVEWPEA